MHIFPLFYNFMPRNLNSSTMKRLFQLIALLIFISVSTANAQERHFSYRYSGTTYKAKGGGETTMVNKLSTSPLKGEFIASILPDHKTVWLYSSAINARCTGKGVYQDGGYRYNSPLSNADVLTLVIGDQMPTGGYTIFIKSDNSRITCISTEEDGEYYSVRYDYYNRISSVSAPNNSKRSELERKEAESKASSERLEKELAEERAQREREQKAFNAKLQSSIGSEFPMAHFIDSHGNRVDSSFFKRGKKTLVVTYMVGCTPNRELKKVLDGYPQLSSQIINIHLSQTSYSKFKNNASAPVRTDRIYYNPNEGDNRNWIYGRSYPCIILLDEYGKVLSYKFGFSREKDLGYITDIINQMLGRKAGNGAPYKVGDYYKNGKTEGIVFEVYDNGYSGKIVSLKHSDKILKWRERGTLNIGKTFGITDGEDIMRYRGLAEYISGDAFSWCRRLGVGWYLPTIDELKSIYANRAVIEPKLTDKLERYWSSTEYSADEAYCIEKGTGAVWHSNKYYGCYIRAVKSFGNVPRQKQKSTSAPYKIGDFYNENGKTGIVFEVNSDGTSGKIYTISPVSEARWASDQSEADNLVGANDSSDGANNLEAVMRIPDWQSKYPAFAACAKLGDGWYLPAIDELGKIVGISRDCVIPIKIIRGVWSSTEKYSRDEVSGYYKRYSDYDIISDKTNKHNEYRVYAVTRFGESENSKNISYEQSHSPYKVGDLYNEDGMLGVVVETWDSGRSGKILSLAESRKTWSDAECYCKSLGDRWRLPSVEELRLLSLDKNHYNAIEKTFERYGSDLNGSYWSSTKSGNTILNKYPTAYIVKGDGEYSDKPVCNNYYVRAIAEFGTTQRPKTTLAREKSSAPYKVGDYYNDGEKDGIVFEVSADGRHGKIVSIKESMFKLPWSKEGCTFNGAKSKKDGAANMEIIKQQDNWSNNYPAFAWCTTLGDEWYIPSVKELQALYQVREVVNKALPEALKSHYWSSTESKKADKYYKEYYNYYKELSGALCVYIDDGKIYNQAKPKTYEYKLRAVAKF